MLAIFPQVEAKTRRRVPKNAGSGEKWLYKTGPAASFRAPVGTRIRPTIHHFPS